MNRLRNALLLLVLFATLGAQTAAADAVAGIYHRGTGSRSYDISDYWALSAFSLNYMYGDNHIRSIALLPHHTLYFGDEVYFEFTDNSQDDDIEYYVKHWNASEWSFSGIYDLEGGNCTGSCTTYIGKPANHTFVISDFTFRFTNGDHHLDEFEIMESNGYLTVRFNDKNNDDPFHYTVAFLWVPNDEIAATYDWHGSRANDRVILYRDDYSAISGFSLDFEDDCTGGDDHHIREIGITMSEIQFNDKNGDDCFDWHLKWAVFEEGSGFFF